MEKTMQKKFEAIYEGCTLYAVQLDGFSHTVYYKDKNGAKHIDGYSAYSPEQKREDELFEDGVYRSFNSEKAKQFLGGYGHYSFQGNAREIVFKPRAEWDKK